jgi:hypothetical protein
MDNRTPNVEWIIAQNDTEWEGLQGPPLPNSESAAHRRLPLKRYIWSVATLFLLLASAGGWLWHTDQAGLQQAKVDVTAAAQQELWAAPDPEPLAASVSDDQTAPHWRLQLAREDRELLAAVKADKSGAQFDLNVRVLAVQDDRAVVSVSAAAIARATAYWQTRFYQRTSTGWQRTEPNAALWGPERRLATPSFVFHFRQNDAPAVIAVVPQIEALYTTLRSNFALPVTFGAEKLDIEVSITQSSRYEATWFGAPDRISVPSPVLYWAPVELTDAELLAQSLVLPLLGQVLTQASERDQSGSSWRPLLDGLRLWQVWDLDLPLAVWREEVVRWIYVGLPATRPGQAVVLPERYTALCAAHKLWMSSPVQLNIPLLCAERYWEDWYLAPWASYDPSTRLDQFSVPAPKALVGPPHPVHHPGQTVALATLIEYAVATYGRERLPALVAGLGQYDSWDTLIPAVYGVSAAEFEAGWQAYLAAHYGV